MKNLYIFLSVICIENFAPHPANAAYCAGASRMGCYPGIDHSGRSSDALYKAAQEGLQEATTPEENALAQQAMKDAFDPKMSDPIARLCNSPAQRGSDWQKCLRSHGEEDDFNPFGIHAGDSLNTLKIIGQVHDHPEIQEISPPISNPIFQHYYVESSDKIGVCSVVAKTNPLSGAQDGSDTIEKFQNLSAVISRKYGDPRNSSTGDTFSYRTWNANLFLTGRNLSNMWEGPDLGGPLSQIQYIRLGPVRS